MRSLPVDRQPEVGAAVRSLGLHPPPARGERAALLLPPLAGGPYLHTPGKAVRPCLSSGLKLSLRRFSLNPEPRRQVPDTLSYPNKIIAHYFSWPDMTNLELNTSHLAPRIKSTRGRAATERLNRALLEMASRGQRPRCSDYGADLWTSDRLTDRQEAARLCQGCPVQTECLAAAQARRERFGVFGGRDMTPKK
jgi:Transcription factor WhiB